MMRYGFTTGSCAAAAAKAAAYMLLTGKEKTSITIETPKGIPFSAQIEAVARAEQKVRCAVRKDGGDDPDITTGALVFAEVSIAEVSGRKAGTPGAEAGTPGAEEKRVEISHHPDIRSARIRIDGGVGVGRVTRPGLDQPVGSAAINRVPRKMIEREVREVCALTDYSGTLKVVISIPEGVELSRNTFNPRLGIVGGLSVLGTTGIVEPMSSQALLDTIRAELQVKKAEGCRILAVSPGNYGLDFLRERYGYDLDRSVKCSNFIGDTIDMAAELGFEAMLLTGHIGKLVKLSGGIMNTHSREGDCRMELLAAAAVRAGAPGRMVRELLDCATTEDAVKRLQDWGGLEPVMGHVMERACGYLARRAAGRIRMECMMYANGFGELGKSAGAEELLDRIRRGE